MTLSESMTSTTCVRTHNSDCCPDYFTHCEGLTSEAEDTVYYQRGGEPSTIQRPTHCLHGVLNINSRNLTILLSFKT